MTRVVIGMDPHKRSVTIEVMTPNETVLEGGRYATDGPGYAAMLGHAKRWPERVWAIEGCSGIGRHVATRLLADGEQVVDVPPKMSARVRVFCTGQGRKTDATDAHSVALVGTRMAGLRPVVDDQQLAGLRVLADRRRALGENHTRMIAQLHHLLLELIAGGAKKDLSAAQAKALLAKVRPRDAAGKARRRVAAELIADLERIYTRKKTADKELRELIAATGNAPSRVLTQRGAMRGRSYGSAEGLVRGRTGAGTISGSRSRPELVLWPTRAAQSGWVGPLSHLTQRGVGAPGPLTGTSLPRRRRARRSCPVPVRPRRRRQPRRRVPGRRGAAS